MKHSSNLRIFTSGLLVAATMSVGFCASAGEVTRNEYPQLAKTVPGTLFIIDGGQKGKASNAVTFNDNGTVTNLEALGLSSTDGERWKPGNDSEIRILFENGQLWAILHLDSDKGKYQGEFKAYLPPLRMMHLGIYSGGARARDLVWSNDPASLAWLEKQQSNEIREADELKTSLRGNLSTVSDLGPINYCLNGTTNCPDTEEFQTLLLAHFNSKQNPDLVGRIELERRMDEFEWETLRVQKLEPAFRVQHALLSFRPTLTYDFQSRVLNVAFSYNSKVGAVAMGMVGGIHVPLMRMESLAIPMLPEKAKALKAANPIFSMSARVTVAPQEISYFECRADGEKIPVTAAQKADFEREGVFCDPVTKRGKVLRLTPVRYALCANKDCVRGP